MSLSEPQVTFSQADWEKYALCYDSLQHLDPYMNMLRMVAGHVIAGSEEALLDASCGTGNFEQVLLESPVNHSMSIIGVDTSREMLARARKKCASSVSVTFLEVDLNQPLVFEDCSFSQIASINTLYAVKDPSYTLSEFYRVLGSGGRLLLVTPHKGYENGLIMKAHCESTLPDEFWMDAHATPEREELLIRKAIKSEAVVRDMLTIAKHNRNIAHNNDFHFFHEEDLILLLKKVGFSVTHSSLTYANQDNFVIAKKGT